MADDRDLTPILLVDRAGQGGFEFQYDGRAFCFRRGQVTLTTYADVARFLFRSQKLMVWTRQGEFAPRLAMRDAPGFEGVAEGLAQELGPDLLDTGEGIELDTTRPEGWDLNGAERNPEEVALVSTGASRGDFREQLGRGSRIVGAARG